MTKAQTLYSFFSSFGIPAYEKSAVPTDEENKPDFPYLTYDLVTDSFGTDVPLSVSLWYRDRSGYSALAASEKKKDELSCAIGLGGVFLECDGGRIWLRRGSPFAQVMRDESDSAIKRQYINITAEFMTAD